MRTRTGLAAALAPIVLAAAFGPRPAQAFPRPDLAATVGSTFAVSGTPNGGGTAMSLALLWPIVDTRASFGAEFFAHDLGTQFDQLRDPNNGTDLGRVAFTHRWTYGGMWRVDAPLLPAKSAWMSDVTGAWGYWRLEDDLQGITRDAVSALGVVLGVDARHSVGETQSLGIAVHFTRLFVDREIATERSDRYLTAALEWRWLGSSQP